MARESGPDLDHIRDLAARLAALDPGPAAELGIEVAAAVASMSARIDALWQLISAIVESAGLSVPDAIKPPPTSSRHSTTRAAPAAGGCG